MSILNTATCVAGVGNTGIPDCAFDPKNLKGGFLVPPSFALTDTQLASSITVLAALKAAINADDPAQRIYPLPETVAFTDNSEAPVVETLGYGIPVTVRDGNYKFTFQYTKGGVCLSKQLQKFNGSNYGWIGVDASGNLIGTKSGTSLQGVPLYQFYANPFKFNDGSKITNYSYEIAFAPNYINQNIAFVPLNYSDIVGLTGLLSVNISLAIPRAMNVITVKLTAGCSGKDLYDTYSGEFGSVGNFKVTEKGANVDITSVVLNTNLKAFTLTLSTTDPDYDLAGPFIVDLAPISILNAVGIFGFEGLPLTVL